MSLFPRCIVCIPRSIEFLLIVPFLIVSLRGCALSIDDLRNRKHPLDMTLNSE